MKFTVEISNLLDKINSIWRKKYIEMFFVIAILGTPILFYFNSQVNDYLIFYTLVTILWYSRETMDLKRNSNKELDRLRVEHKTNLRPYLRLQKGGSRGLILVNVGKGVAVNLRPVFIKNNIRKSFLKVPAMSTGSNSVTESFVPINFGMGLNPIVSEFTVEIS